MFFAKSKFPTKMVILARLEAILEPLGTILVPLGAVLGLPGGRQGGRTGSRRAQGERRESAGRAQADRSGTPPP